MYYSIDTMSRTGFKWTVNEILSLQREFELLGWDVNEIASKHQRTPNAIMFKLDQEGFADYNVLYSNYHSLNAPMQSQNVDDLFLDNDNVSVDDDTDEDYVDNAEEDDEDDEDDEIANLSERVYGLEENISEIRDMLKQLMSNKILSSIDF